MPDETQIRSRAGTCDIDGMPIKDTPENGNAGYMGVFPARHEDGSPKAHTVVVEGKQVLELAHPPHKRVLCREHYLEEYAEMYPEIDIDALRWELEAPIRDIKAKYGIE